MMKVMIEEFYQGKLEEKLGYTKYDYRNKNSNNSKNGQVVKEIGVNSYSNFKYILKEEFKFKRMKV